MNKKIKTWLTAARLRTLPLAFSCIIMGTAAALFEGKFNLVVFSLALLTTLFLQVLSNFANDYGDALSGKDNEGRIGPKRAVSSGEISVNAMKKGLIITSILSFVSGLGLLFFAFGSSIHLVVFLLIGIAAIAAAIKYTVGKNPYGYAGFGDFFVFLFFGIVGVFGSYFLYTQSFNWLVLLPAITIGLLSVAVLNTNNMRDIENDKATNKNTLAVKLGLQNAKTYHAILIIGAFLSITAFSILSNLHLNQYTYLLILPFFLFIMKKTLGINNPVHFDPFLKKTALATFALSMLFLLATFMG